MFVQCPLHFLHEIFIMWGNIITVSIVWCNKLRSQDPLCTDVHQMANVHQPLSMNQGLVYSSTSILMNGEHG